MQGVGRRKSRVLIAEEVGSMVAGVTSLVLTGSCLTSLSLGSFRSCAGEAEGGTTLDFSVSKDSGQSAGPERGGGHLVGPPSS